MGVPGPQDGSMLGTHKKHRDAVVCYQHVYAMNKVRSKAVSLESWAVTRTCRNCMCHRKDLDLV